MTSKRISTRIEAVTVYSAGARVRRSGEVWAERGDGADAHGGGTSGSSGADGGAARFPASVCVTGLPLALDDASVRVTVEPAYPRPAAPADGSTAAEPAAADGLPAAVDARVVLDVPDRDPDLAPAVPEALAAARVAARRVIARMEQVNRELDRLAKLAFVPRPEGADGAAPPAPPPESPLEARLSLLSFRQARERALRDELAALQDESRERDEALRRLEDQDRRASTARQPEEHELRKAVVVTLAGPDAAGADRARLVVHYLVPGARWAPAYAVRLSPDADRAELAMRAVVAQRTGEDWTGVALTLSTADPQGYAELPELSSLRIGRRQPAPRRRGWREPPLGAGELYRDYDLAFRASPGRQLPLGGLSGSSDAPTVPVPTAAPRAPMTLEPEELLDDLSGTHAYDYPAEAADFDIPGPIMAPSGAAPPASMAAPEQARGRWSRRSRSDSAPAPKAGGPAGPPQAIPSLPPPASMAGAPPPAGLFRAQPGRSAGAPRLGGPGGSADALGDATRPYAAMGAMEDFDGEDTPTTAMPDFQAFARAASGPLAAPEDLLAYGDLRMPSPRDPGRGALALSSRTAVYLELLSEQRVEIEFDPIAVIARARRRADEVADAEVPPGHVPAASDLERYDYAYAAETPADVPSDGAFHALPLVARDASVALRHVVVPRESTDVFRLAALDNPLDAPILPGPVDVHLGGDFLLTTRAPFTPPGGALTLGLGVEQAVKVSRNTAFREETAGLMRGSLLLKHAIRISVESHLSRAVECEVRERVPVLREDEEDIELSVTSVEPPWEPYEPPEAGSPEAGLRGGHVWRVVLERGDKRELSVAYDVRISGKHELVGGNRREA